MLSRLVTRNRAGVSLLRHSVQQKATFSFASRPLFEEKKSGEYDVDKVDPQYLPYEHHPYAEDLNKGRNVAPAGTYEWSDLPAPYNSYRVKVDPKDVEEPGFLYKLFSNPITAVPLGGLLSLPFFYHDVILVDEVLELSLITLSTFAIIHRQFAGKVSDMLTQMRDEVKKEILTAEKEYVEALDECLDVHERAAGSADYLRSLHEAERGLKAIEAAAKTRAVKTDQRNKMVAMLDYLILLKESDAQDRKRQITNETFVRVQNTFGTDKKVQQASINSALARLTASGEAEDVMEKVFQEQAKAAEAAIDGKFRATAAQRKAEARNVFRKRFGLAQDEVTEAMLERAKADPAEMVVLTAKTGGSPSPGAPINRKLPIDY